MQHLKIMLLASIGITIAFASAYAQPNTLAPLEQLKSGVMLQDVKCKENFVLVIKSSNDQPSCVRPSSEQRLLVQGWIIPKFETIQTNHNETIGITHQKVIPMINGASNTTANTIPQNNMILLNNVSNAIGTNGTDNGTITESMIYKWYNDSFANGPVPQLAGVSDRPLSAIQVTPTISSNYPNTIKVLLIGMSPNQLKVGDKPEFTLTYQNVSDKPIKQVAGCTRTPLGAVITPSDNVLMSIGDNRATCPDMIGPIYPNQISTSTAAPDPASGHLGTMYPLFSPGGFYQITKPGTLHVSLELFLQDEQGKAFLTETVQFDVNATQ